MYLSGYPTFHFPLAKEFSAVNVHVLSSEARFEYVFAYIPPAFPVRLEESVIIVSPGALRVKYSLLNSIFLILPNAPTLPMLMEIFAEPGSFLSAAGSLGAFEQEKRTSVAKKIKLIDVS